MPRWLLAMSADESLTPAELAQAYAANWAVSDWYLDGTTGNDANNGVTALTPLKTGAELARRLGPWAMWGQSVTVHVLENGMIDALVLAGSMLVPGTHLDVTGVATVLATDVVAAYQNLSHVGTPTATHLTSTAIVDWTPYVGKRVRFTSGTALDAVVWVGAASPGGIGLNVAQTCRTSRIDQTSTTSLQNVTNIIPTVGTSFVVESLPVVPSISINLGGTVLDSAGPQWPVRCCAVMHVECQEISYNAPDVDMPCRSICFGCAIGTISSPVMSAFFASFRRVGFHLKYPVPRTAVVQSNLCGSYYCGLCTVPENDCEFGATISLTYVLFQNARLVPRGCCTITTADLQWFDCASTSAVFSVPSGANIIQSRDNSGARNSGYGIWLANNIRGRFIGTWNVQTALGDAQLIATPTISLTASQAFQFSDYAQKGTSGALVAGTVTVTVPWYDNVSQKVTVSHAVFAGVPGILSVQQISSTQFTITSASVADTSTVNWAISPLGRAIVLSP